MSSRSRVRGGGRRRARGGRVVIQRPSKKQLYAATRSVARVPRSRQILRPSRNSGISGISPLWSSLGSAAGALFGPAGGPVGSLIGQGAGMAFRAVTGHGDYKVIENTLVKAAPIPSFGAHEIRVQNKEFIGDIVSSKDFKVQASIDINPALPGSFPWLSNISRCFEQYHMNGMIFSFVSTCATAIGSVSTALGTVIQATDYDAANPAYISKVEMLAAEFSNAGKPSEDMMHPIECATSRTPTMLLYTRTGAVPPRQDQRLFDLGRYQLATSGMQTVGDTIGELWVTYDVTLCKPIFATVGTSVPSSHWKVSGLLSSFFANAELFDPKATQVSVDFDPVSNVLTLPHPGIDAPLYKVDFLSQDVKGGLAGPVVVTPTNCSIPFIWLGPPPTTPIVQVLSGDTTVYTVSFFIQTVPRLNASVKISGYVGTAAASGDVIITQVNNLFI
jgi:hypothetical protein